MIKINNNYHIAHAYMRIYNNMEIRGTNRTPKPADVRLADESFAADVRAVLEFMGVEPTRGNFRKYDRMINWHEFARNIRNPKYAAKCFLLWGEKQSKWHRSTSDRKVYHEGEAVTTTVYLAGQSRDEALAGLDTRAYEFIEWE